MFEFANTLGKPGWEDWHALHLTPCPMASSIKQENKPTLSHLVLPSVSRPPTFSGGMHLTPQLMLTEILERVLCPNVLVHLGPKVSVGTAMLIQPKHLWLPSIGLTGI